MDRETALATWYESLNSVANTVYTEVGVRGDKVSSDYALRATALMSEVVPHVLGRKDGACLHAWARGFSLLYSFALYSYMSCPRNVMLVGIPGSERSALLFGDVDRLVESFLVAGMLLCASPPRPGDTAMIIAKALYGKLSEAHTARSLIIATPLQCMVSGSKNIGGCGIRGIMRLLRGIGIVARLLKATTSTHKVLVIFMK